MPSPAVRQHRQRPLPYPNALPLAFKAANKFAALGQTLRMAADDFQTLQLGPFGRQEMMLNLFKMFADNEKGRTQQQ